MRRMGIACLGIVAVDTAKTLKMEWEGWEGWESRVWVVAVDTAKTLKMLPFCASRQLPHAALKASKYLGTTSSIFDASSIARSRVRQRTACLQWSQISIKAKSASMCFAIFFDRSLAELCCSPAHPSARRSLRPSCIGKPPCQPSICCLGRLGPSHVRGVGRQGRWTWSPSRPLQILRTARR